MGMKLLKIVLPKNKTHTKGDMVRALFKKYPDADFDSIYATMFKAGYEISFGSIRSIKSCDDRARKIKSILGEK
jgi:hypothetical protein